MTQQARVATLLWFASLSNSASLPQQTEVLLSPRANSISLSGLATIILFSGFLFLVVLSEGRNVPSNFSLSQYITCYLGAAFDV